MLHHPKRGQNPLFPAYGCCMVWVIMITSLPHTLCARLAQLVEHIIRNDGADGSNPSAGTTFSLKCHKNQVALSAVLPCLSHGCSSTPARIGGMGYRKQVGWGE